MCPNIERRHVLIIAVRLGCLVILLSPHLIIANRLVHLIPSSILRHYWSRASVLRASTLVIAQYSDLYRKIGRIQVLYNFNYVGIEIHDFQKWLSRLCIAAQVIPLRRTMSRVLCVGEWMRQQRYTNSSTTATCCPWTVMVDGTLESSKPSEPTCCQLPNYCLNVGMQMSCSTITQLSTYPIFLSSVIQSPPPHHNRFTALYPGPPGWASARREPLDFMVQGKTNRGKNTDHPAGRHSIRANQCPPPPSPPFFYRPDALPAAQPTVSKFWRQLAHAD